MAEISASLAPYVPRTYFDAKGQLLVSVEKAESAAKTVQAHVQSLPAADAEIFLALMQEPDLAPRPTESTSRLETRLNTLQKAIETIDQFFGLAEDVNLLAMLLIKHGNALQKEALQSRLEARSDAKSELMKQAGEMRHSADEMRSGAVTSLVIAVVSAAVSIGLSGASIRASAKSASILKDMKAPVAPKATTTAPKVKAADTGTANPVPTRTAPVTDAPDPVQSPAPGPVNEASTLPATSSTSSTADPAAAPATTTSSEVEETNVGAATQVTAAADPVAAAPDPAQPASGNADTGNGSTGNGASGDGSGSGNGSSANGSQGTTTGDSGSVSDADKMDFDVKKMQFEADKMAHDAKMADMHGGNARAQHFSSLAGMANTLGQASSNYVSTTSQAQAKMFDATAAEYAAIAQNLLADADLAKDTQDSVKTFVARMVDLLAQYRSLTADRYQSFSRI